MSGNVIVCKKLEIEESQGVGMMLDDVARYGVLRLRVKSIIANLSDNNRGRE